MDCELCISTPEDSTFGYPSKRAESRITSLFQAADAKGLRSIGRIKCAGGAGEKSGSASAGIFSGTSALCEGSRVCKCFFFDGQSGVHRRGLRKNRAASGWLMFFNDDRLRAMASSAVL